MKSGNGGRRGLPVVVRLRHIPLATAALRLRAFGLGHLPVRYAVKLRRVLYLTSGVDGSPTVASALVALPAGVQPRAVVSYQHGTRLHRLNVPSSPDRLDGVLVAVALAGAGYVLAAPDYLGLGSSPGPHPYLHAATEATCVTDLVTALPEVLADEGVAVPDRLLLLGFSQGGHASLAALEALERLATTTAGLPRPVGVASVAGVHRLLEHQGPHALSTASGNHTAYLALLTSAYARLYGEPLGSLVVPWWARRLPTLLDGTRGLVQVSRRLPDDPRRLLTPAAVADLDGSENGWFARRLTENSVGDLRTGAPVRFYVGSRDQATAPGDAARTTALIRAHGGDAQVQDVGPFDHRGTAFAGLPLVVEWFEQVLAAPDPVPVRAVRTP